MNEKILVFILMYLFLCKIINTRKNEYVIHRDVLTKKEIQEILSCFEKNDINTHCFEYKRKQLYLLKKIKKRLNKNYFNVGMARYSHGNQNFDAQQFHRDIKPLPFYSWFKKYPNVYTIVCAFDDLYHQQGKDKIKLCPGDILVFNAFNLHKGLNMDFNQGNRRILQYFHVFFDQKEQSNFYKNHSFSKHWNNDTYLKYGSFFFKSIIEFLCLSQMITFKKNMFITQIDKKEFIKTIDGINYFRKF
jgi:hypothetical protein